MATPSPPATDEPLVLGVDGGGTKTLAWLATVDATGSHQVVGRGLSASSNILAVGSDVALANLANACNQAFVEAKLPVQPISKAVLALAGSGSPEVQQQVLEFAEKHLQVRSARVVHDGQAVLQAGTPKGWGAALIVGTGAVAYGENPAGDKHVVGGWGYWFGDEGSAFWLGQSALRTISQAADGRADETALTEAVLNRLQVSKPRDVLYELSRRGEVRQEIANLAPLVCELAEQRDNGAANIIAAAAEQWSRHIECLVNRLTMGEDFPLAVAGGVLCRSPFARSCLLRRMSQDQLQPMSIEFVDEPVIGCLQLAAADRRN